MKKKIIAFILSILLLGCTSAGATWHVFGTQTGTVPLSWLDDNFNVILSGGAGSMTYPGAGVAVSTGTSWATSYTNGAYLAVINQNLASTSAPVFAGMYLANQTNLYVGKVAGGYNSALTTNEFDNIIIGQTGSDLYFNADHLVFHGVPYVWPGTQGGASTCLTNSGTGTLSWGACGSGSMTWPTSAGIANYAGSSTWGTSYTLGTGTSLGTSDTTIPSQNAVKVYADTKAPSASPTFTGTVTMPAPTFNTLTGSVQCLEANAGGVVIGTGTSCGSGGGMTWPAGAGVAVYTGGATWGTSLT